MKTNHLKVPDVVGNGIKIHRLFLTNNEDNGAKDFLYIEYINGAFMRFLRAAKITLTL